ncbi:DUF6448 family protein [Streptomyces sp. NPDC014995]|uniref:DUF6448 family protein n=1 Tax=Streptomyces sp. NPDC014995 TaxID=3364936 RepID=UPI0036F87287
MADHWFFETVIRVHHAAEGAPFTRLSAGMLHGEGVMFTSGLGPASVGLDLQKNASLVPEGGINPSATFAQLEISIFPFGGTTVPPSVPVSPAWAPVKRGQRVIVCRGRRVGPLRSGS